MSIARTLVFTALALLSPGLAQAHEHRQDPSDGRSRERGLDGARERWERLSPEQRARLRERFERFRELEPEHRASLEQRARFLSDSVERIESRLAPADRERLARLEPEHRREVLREMALCAGRERGERLHGRMPAEWRERLERVPPEERARVLAQMQARLREGSPREAVEQAARRFGLSREDVEVLRALPEEERRQRLQELRQRFGAREGERDGWRKEGGDLARKGGRDGAPPERGDAQRRLGDALRPRPEDVLRFAELPTDERRSRIRGLMRERVLAVLRDGALATPDEVARFEQLPLSEIQAAIRAKFPPPDCEPGGREGAGARGPERHGDRTPDSGHEHDSRPPGPRERR